MKERTNIEVYLHRPKVVGGGWANCVFVCHEEMAYGGTFYESRSVPYMYPPEFPFYQIGLFIDRQIKYHLEEYKKYLPLFQIYIVWQKSGGRRDYTTYEQMRRYHYKNLVILSLAKNRIANQSIKTQI